MDDSEYYAKMRKQYSNPIKIPKSKNKQANSSNNISELKTPGTFSSWEKKYGREDAEMFMERNDELNEQQDNWEKHLPYQMPVPAVTFPARTSQKFVYRMRRTSFSIAGSINFRKANLIHVSEYVNKQVCTSKLQFS